MERDNAVIAKITRPNFARVCQRTGLYGLLDELNTTPLIMVSGAPGAGKTTLVACYVDYRKIPCLWYQLDAGDEDLATFFHFFSIAAHSANADNKSALPHVPSQRALSKPERIKSYFHDLFDCLPNPFLMVFDDYHQVAADAPLHDVIQTACAELPRAGRIILISNNQCPPNMACVITNRTTAVIEDEDLRLSPGEAEEIAALHGVTLPAEEIARQLHDKAGGWTPELILTLKKELHSPLIT